jgi:four helix bundle protein
MLKILYMNHYLVSESVVNYGWSDFQNLTCWKSAHELKKKSAALIKGFPEAERFRLSDQILRSSRSVTANIAEGYGRYHYKDQVRFCINARGSLVELYDHLITARAENYITDQQISLFHSDISDSILLLNGYIKYLNKRLAETKNQHNNK